jgi:hypothetical protein
VTAENNVVMKKVTCFGRQNDLFFMCVVNSYVFLNIPFFPSRKFCERLDRSFVPLTINFHYPSSVTMRRRLDGISEDAILL